MAGNAGFHQAVRGRVGGVFNLSVRRREMAEQEEGEPGGYFSMALRRAQLGVIRLSISAMHTGHVTTAEC
jgi:hypothetical protein